MRKVNVNKLWLNIGSTIQIDETLETKYLLKGGYIVCEKEEYGYNLMNIHTNERVHLDEWEDDSEVIVYITDEIDKVNSLITYYTTLIIALISEGWTVKEDYRSGLDLTSHYDSLIGFVKLREILENG